MLQVCTRLPIHAYVIPPVGVRPTSRVTTPRHPLPLPPHRRFSLLQTCVENKELLTMGGTFLTGMMGFYWQFNKARKAELLELKALISGSESRSQKQLETQDTRLQKQLETQDIRLQKQLETQDIRLQKQLEVLGIKIESVRSELKQQIKDSEAVQQKQLEAQGARLQKQIESVKSELKQQTKDSEAVQQKQLEAQGTRLQKQLETQEVRLQNQMNILASNVERIRESIEGKNGLRDRVTSLTSTVTVSLAQTDKNIANLQDKFSDMQQRFAVLENQNLSKYERRGFYPPSDSRVSQPSPVDKKPPIKQATDLP